MLKPTALVTKAEQRDARRVAVVCFLHFTASLAATGPLQKWLVVGTVRVPTADAEPTPGLQYSRSIVEPWSQRAIELLSSHDSESADRAGAERR